GQQSQHQAEGYVYCLVHACSCIGALRAELRLPDTTARPRLLQRCYTGGALHGLSFVCSRDGGFVQTTLNSQARATPLPYNGRMLRTVLVIEDDAAIRRGVVDALKFE